MYEPHRSARYEYITELISDIEKRQCGSCAFSKLVDSPQDPNSWDFPMCWQVEGETMLEKPVECLDEQPDGVVVCTVYRSAELVAQEKDQEVLFES